jgi:Ca-activated chloride channel homolog
MPGSRRFALAGALSIAVFAVACSGAPSATPRGGTPNDHHWQPTPPPRPVWTPPPMPGATGAATFGNTFEDPGVNPFIPTWRDNESTFAMDVDTASYDVARRFIEGGQLPPFEAVRLEEFVNSFDYGYRPPVETAFAVHVDGGSTPFAPPRSLLLRIGIQGQVIPDEQRAPASLTFVVDTSGSMDLDNRIALVRDALSILVDSLGPQDTVAIVEFGTEARAVLNPTSAAEPDVIIAAVQQLRASGSTNAQAGLELGYSVANYSRRPGAINRVILASDGVANVGLTDADSLLAQIDREVESGIDLVTVGVGLGNFNDVLLEQLADRGNGFYAYLNDHRDAQQLFGERLTGTLQLIARDAKVQVTFRPEAVSAYRLLGYENRSMHDDDFENPYVDAGEIGAGHSVTALYEVELAAGAAEGPLGNVAVRWTPPQGGLEQSVTRDIGLGDIVSDWSRSDPGFQLAVTVGAFAEILRESPWTGYSMHDVLREAESIARYFPGDERVRELVELISRATGLSRW